MDVAIAEEIFSCGDRKKIEKAIAVAFNVAVDNMKEIAAQEMTKLAGGMNILGLSDMLK